MSKKNTVSRELTVKCKTKQKILHLQYLLHGQILYRIEISFILLIYLTIKHFLGYNVRFKHLKIDCPYKEAKNLLHVKKMLFCEALMFALFWFCVLCPQCYIAQNVKKSS